MKLSLLIALIGLIATGCSFGQQPDLASPKSTVQALMEAVQKDDIKTIARCVEGIDETQLPPQRGMGFGDATTLKDLKFVVEVTGDTATVAVSFEVIPKKPLLAGTDSFSYVEMFSLKKAAAGWLIVPEKYPVKGTDPSFRLRSRPVQNMIAQLAAWQSLKKAEKIAEAGPPDSIGKCLFNLTKLGEAVKMYTEDQDGKLPASQSEFRTALTPYLRSIDQFHCPLDAKGAISYSMNANLYQRKMAEIHSPAETVLMYEGTGGLVEYRHGRMACVCFADGHVKMMTPEQMKSAIRKLPPPTTGHLPAKQKLK